jgi:hypothetical protein
MKKIYSLIAVVLVTCSTGFGQVEIKLWDNGTQSATGNTLNGEEHVYSVSTDGLHSVVINFKNVSGIAKNWKIERYRITDAVLWEDSFRWGIVGDPFGFCFASSQMSTNPWMGPDISSMTIASGESANLIADTYTEGTGTEKYRFYLIEGQSTRVDSVDVKVNTSMLGIADQQKEEVLVSVYPNPVSNVLTVSTKGLEGTVELKIVDVLGKVVLAESGSPINKIDVSNFKNGVYLVSVSNKGIQVQTKRIVIKH